MEHYQCPKQPIIQPYLLVQIMDWAQAQGYRVAELLAAFAVPSRHVLDDPHYRLSALQYQHGIAWLYQQGHADLGVQIGQTLNLSSYGILGHAMQSAPTVADAAWLGVTYAHLTSHFMQITASLTPDGLCIRATQLYDLAALQRFAREEHVVGAVAVARQLIGATFSPLSVHISGARPPYAASLEAWLDAPVYYEADCDQFLLSSSVLAQPLPHAHAYTAKQLAHLCEQLSAEQARYPAQSRLSSHRQPATWCLQQLQQDLDQCDPRHWPSQAEYAQRLGVSERTLRRRLQQLNTDYRQQQDQIRLHRAKALLHQSDLTVEQIAHRLGYSEPASFRRAFVRWTGHPPRALTENIPPDDR